MPRGCRPAGAEIARRDPGDRSTPSSRSGGRLAPRPPATSVVVTGRDAPAALLELADLVTETRAVKPPRDRGLPALPGTDL